MTVVFTDSFTVSSDTDIDAYPSGSADYAYNVNSGAALTVDAGNDRVDLTVQAHAKARIIDSAVSGLTGDQQISIHGTFRGAAGFSSAEAVCRMATSSNFDNFYIAKLESSETNECRIYRSDNGSYTLLVSADRGITALGGVEEEVDIRFKATGTGSTVSLEAQFNATSVVTTNDTSASRKTSGLPGIGAWRGDAGDVIWIDDVSVDDLSSGATTRRYGLTTLGVG